MQGQNDCSISGGFIGLIYKRLALRIKECRRGWRGLRASQHDVALIPTEGPAILYPNFERLLSDFRSLEATDPRDKVHALLGLAMTNKNLVKPDYSLTIRQVYTGIAQSLLGADEQDPLRRFSHVQKTDETHKLPSWVPDWS